MKRRIDRTDVAAGFTAAGLFLANAWVLGLIFIVGYCFMVELENELKTQRRTQRLHLSLYRHLSGDYKRERK